MAKPAREADSPARGADASTGAATPPIGLADYRDRLTRTSISLEELRIFLARPETRNAVLALVGAKVPPDDVEDRVQDTLVEAIKAFETAPPEKDEVLKAWLATITQRTVADYLEKRGRRRKYEGPMPDRAGGASLDSTYDDGPDSAGDESDHPFGAGPHPSLDTRDGSVDELDIKGMFLFQWLERQVANNPLERETFEMVLEHGLRQKTYQTIAKEHGISLTVLSSRVYEFKKKYIPRYKRERNRTVLLLLLFGVAFAVAVYLLFRVPDAPRRPHAAPPRPLIDEIFGGPPGVGTPPLNEEDIQPDGGSRAPKE